MTVSISACCKSLRQLRRRAGNGAGRPALRRGEVDSDAKKAWRKQYFRELLRLQGELVKLQDWVMRTGHRLVIIFEGRDAAGRAA
ncbi:hypothetical protein M8494_09670 [Serratia ureilytica]